MSGLLLLLCFVRFLLLVDYLSVFCFSARCFLFVAVLFLLLAFYLLHLSCFCFVFWLCWLCFVMIVCRVLSLFVFVFR